MSISNDELHQIWKKPIIPANDLKRVLNSNITNDQKRLFSNRILRNFNINNAYNAFSNQLTNIEPRILQNDIFSGKKKFKGVNNRIIKTRAST